MADVVQTPEGASGRTVPGGILYLCLFVLIGMPAITFVSLLFI